MTQSKSDDTLPLTQCTGSGSSFGSLSGSLLGSEDVLDRSQQNTPDNCKENDDYETFLRDMAGSFEAVYDDEEAESECSPRGGRDGAHRVGEKNEKSQEDSYDTFLREMAGSFVDDDDDEDDDDDSGSSDDDSEDESSKQSVEKDCEMRNEEAEGRARLAPSPTTQYRQSPLWKGSHTVRCSSTGELQSMDKRSPVLDSYDMVTALLAQSRKMHVDESCRAHYGRVGLEMLRELKSLEEQLAQLSN